MLRRHQLVACLLLTPLAGLAYRLGPPEIRKCPNCPHLFRQTVALSGSNVGAVYWTDGKMQADGMPRLPALKKCQDCATVFWAKDTELVGEIDWGAKEPKWRDVAHAHDPNEADLLAVAPTLAARPERERYARLQAWWLRNDPVRLGKPAPILTNPQRDNLRRLVVLLDSNNPDDRLLHAEIERHLGNFEACATLLRGEFPGEYASALTILRQLAAARNTDVARW